jgi:hypothetical protein
MKRNLKLVEPADLRVMQKVPSCSRNPAGRKTNAEYGRNRKYLRPDEVERLIKATTNKRDALMIGLAFRHALRVTELVKLEWDSRLVFGDVFPNEQVEVGTNFPTPFKRLCVLLASK